MRLSHKKSKRSGLSLLEVLTALAIFMLSVVVISQMVDSASRTAFRAQKLTKAALLCESKMAELVMGIEPLQSTGRQTYDDPEPGWTYSVDVVPENWSNVQVDGEGLAGLNTVHVTVYWSAAQASTAIEYTLSRMIMDPRLRVPAPPTTTGATQGN